MKITISWSGGKDSAYALYKLLQSKMYEVESLHTTFDAELKRVGMHGVPEQLIEAQATSLGIPLEKIYIPKDNTHRSYEHVMQDFYTRQKEKGISHIMYGDIFLEDLREYRDKQLAVAGLQSIYPLWKKQTDKVIKEFITEGFKTVVCAANSALINRKKLGKTIGHQWLESLPEGVDPCGENGEFHTFVYDGPLFQRPVEFDLGEVVERSYEYKRKTEEGTIVTSKSVFSFQELLPK